MQHQFVRVITSRRLKLCCVCSTHGRGNEYKILLNKLHKGKSLWGHCIGLNLRIILNWAADKSIANKQLD